LLPLVFDVPTVSCCRDPTLQRRIAACRRSCGLRPRRSGEPASSTAGRPWP